MFSGLAIKLFLGGVFKRLSGLLGLVRAYPLHCALIVAVLAAGCLWRGKQSALAERDAARAQTAQVIKAGQQALAAQKKEYDDARAKGAAIKKDQDNDNKTDRAAASAAGDKYAANNGLRKVCRSGAVQTSASAENSDPGVSQVAPTETELVAITRADFDKCTALYPYANGAYKWGVVLREAGLGE